MAQQEIIALLHQRSTEITDRTPFCPDDYEIAAYFDRMPGHSDSGLPEQHLISCGYCLARISVLAQVHKDSNGEQVPQSLIASAEKFGHQPRRRWHHTAAWAAAAVVILTLVTVVERGPRIDPVAAAPPPITRLPGPETRQLRSLKRGTPAPIILAPTRGAVIGPEDLTIRWSSVPGSLYYDFRLVTADGFLVWQDRVEVAQLVLPADLSLLPGDQYFVRVDAYLAEAKSVSSPHVQFTIAASE